jgi:hypothetical protein
MNNYLQSRSYNTITALISTILTGSCKKKEYNLSLPEDNDTLVISKVRNTIKQQFVIFDSSLYHTCSSRTHGMIMRIASELKQNNMFWYISSEEKLASHNRKIIAELLDKEVLYKTETTGIYIVNPIHIRYGNISSVLYSTLELLIPKSSNKPIRPSEVKPFKVRLEHIKSTKSIRVDE